MDAKINPDFTIKKLVSWATMHIASSTIALKSKEKYPRVGSTKIAPVKRRYIGFSTQLRFAHPNDILVFTAIQLSAILRLLSNEHKLVMIEDAFLGVCFRNGNIVHASDRFSHYFNDANKSWVMSTFDIGKTASASSIGWISAFLELHDRAFPQEKSIFTRIASYIVAFSAFEYASRHDEVDRLLVIIFDTMRAHVTEYFYIFAAVYEKFIASKIIVQLNRSAFKMNTDRNSTNLDAFSVLPRAMGIASQHVVLTGFAIATSINASHRLLADAAAAAQSVLAGTPLTSSVAAALSSSVASISSSVAGPLSSSVAEPLSPSFRATVRKTDDQSGDYLVWDWMTQRGFVSMFLMCPSIGFAYSLNELHTARMVREKEMLEREMRKQIRANLSSLMGAKSDRELEMYVRTIAWTTITDRIARMGDAVQPPAQVKIESRDPLEEAMYVRDDRGRSAFSNGLMIASESGIQLCVKILGLIEHSCEDRIRTVRIACEAKNKFAIDEISAGMKGFLYQPMAPLGARTGVAPYQPHVIPLQVRFD